MRNSFITEGIVLSRTDFGESDRVLTVITSDSGKLRIIAKGVRKPKSKLAGGIELLSVNSLTVLPGRGELDTLISSRLITSFCNIIGDLDRTMTSYNLLKRMNKATEDAVDGEYFQVLRGALQGLDKTEVPINLTELWFNVHFLSVSGHLPNIRRDIDGHMLEPSNNYSFDFEHMAFREEKKGTFNANHIKLLRLAYIAEYPQKLCQVTDINTYIDKVLQLSANLVRLNHQV